MLSCIVMLLEAASPVPEQVNAASRTSLVSSIMTEPSSCMTGRKADVPFHWCRSASGRRRSATAAPARSRSPSLATSETGCDILILAGFVHASPVYMLAFALVCTASTVLGAALFLSMQSLCMLIVCASGMHGFMHQQGRTSVRTRGPDGRVDTREQLHNLDPGSASQFDAEWLGHAERGLQRGGSGGGGRRIPIMGADDPPLGQPQHTRIEEVVRLQPLHASDHSTIALCRDWLTQLNSPARLHCLRGEAAYVSNLSTETDGIHVRSMPRPDMHTHLYLER